MARIAYVDHSYHAKTGSTQFLADILRGRGHIVDFFWDDAWKGESSISFRQIADYDVIIMFQSRCTSAERYYRKLHPNVIYVPMLDELQVHCGSRNHLGLYLEPFQGCKVLSFSSAMHAIATGFGLCSFSARYYPQPESVVSIAHRTRAFFWMRDECMVSWPIVRELTRGTVFDSFHMHVAPDPGSSMPIFPSADERESQKITISTWFPEKADYLNILEQANVFFASRQEEGIGQSFLEAMARGQCVVAPDNATMNEYILHGVNGLLYNPEKPEPLDFSYAAELGRIALQSVIAGHARWKALEERLVKFILTPASETYKGLYQHPPLHAHIDSTMSFENSFSSMLTYYNRLRNSKWRKIGMALGVTSKQPKCD